MGIKRTRENFAKLQIFRYSEELFTAICHLLHPEIEELMNLPSHGLNKDELITVLNELFESHMLVAKRDDRGLFTPSQSEIELALMEKLNPGDLSNITFYGITTGASELFKELNVLYKNET